MPTQLEQAYAHFKAGNTEKAKAVLAQILKQNPGLENAWMLMSWCVTDSEQQKYCFERMLKINPQNQQAIEGLRRLDSPVSPITPPKVVQPQPVKNKGLTTAGVIALVGLLSLVLLCAIVFFVSRIPSSSNNSNQQNTPLPNLIARPDYKQMLEANGFTYFMSDNEGNPSYSSPCDAIAVVKPDVVGFAVNHSSDNDCATEDVGRIISIMYPSEVFDCVITTMNLLDDFDEMLIRTAVGHEVSVVITEYEHTLLILIKDPR